MNAEPHIKKGRKYDQVIAGARDVFMREGFEGASVDVIARDAGVSKATLYSYFPDKQQLFMAVLRVECDLQQRAQMDIEFLQRDVPDALHHLAHTMLGLILSEPALAMFRVCVGEANRFPELGQAFYETGPRTAQRQVAEYLQTEKAAAFLDIENHMEAADTFMQLCRTDMMLKRLMGIGGRPSDKEINDRAAETVRTFLARFRRA